MSTVDSRDLRNHTAEILRQVSNGTAVTITVHRTAAAEIRPVRSTRSQFFNRADLVALLSDRQAEPGLTADLERIAGESTDDLDPLSARGPACSTPAS